MIGFAVNFISAATESDIYYYYYYCHALHIIIVITIIFGCGPITMKESVRANYGQVGDIAQMMKFTIIIPLIGNSFRYKRNSMTL